MAAFTAVAFLLLAAIAGHTQGQFSGGSNPGGSMSGGNSNMGGSMSGGSGSGNGGFGGDSDFPFRDMTTPQAPGSGSSRRPFGGSHLFGSDHDTPAFNGNPQSSFGGSGAQQSSFGGSRDQQSGFGGSRDQQTGFGAGNQQSGFGGSRDQPSMFGGSQMSTAGSTDQSQFGQAAPSKGLFDHNKDTLPQMGTKINMALTLNVSKNWKAGDVDSSGRYAVLGLYGDSAQGQYVFVNISVATPNRGFSDDSNGDDTVGILIGNTERKFLYLNVTRAGASSVYLMDGENRLMPEKNLNIQYSMAPITQTGSQPVWNSTLKIPFSYFPQRANMLTAFIAYRGDRGSKYVTLGRVAAYLNNREVPDFFQADMQDFDFSQLVADNYNQYSDVWSQAMGMAIQQPGGNSFGGFNFGSEQNRTADGQSSTYRPMLGSRLPSVSKNDAGTALTVTGLIASALVIVLLV